MLEEASASAELVDGVVAGAGGTDNARDDDGMSGLSHVTFSIEDGDVDLDRGMIVRGDKTVGVGALAGDVEINVLALVVLHFKCVIIK